MTHRPPPPRTQGQANNWIKNLERPNKLMTLRPTEGDYIKSLAQCVRYGIPVLLENVGEDIDPVLDPLLTKSIFKVALGPIG